MFLFFNKSLVFLRLRVTIFLLRNCLLFQKKKEYVCLSVKCTADAFLASVHSVPLSVPVLVLSFLLVFSITGFKRPPMTLTLQIKSKKTTLKGKVQML